jgi:hypothetical protein
MRHWVPSPACIWCRHCCRVCHWCTWLFLGYRGTCGRWGWFHPHAAGLGQLEGWTHALQRQIVHRDQQQLGAQMACGSQLEIVNVQRWCAQWCALAACSLRLTSTIEHTLALVIACITLMPHAGLPQRAPVGVNAGVLGLGVQ